MNNQRNFYGNQTSESRLPPRGQLDKIYGNLGDVVAYEEKIIEQQMRKNRPYSPNSSQVTMKKVGKQNDKYGQRRMTGLEVIYLQKFDKKPHDYYHNPLKVHSSKAKFRNTIHQFVDDPQLLVDDGADISR